MSVAAGEREAAKARTRERLLSSAAAVFAAKGYGAASLREVARQAGYTTGAVYAHFESKDVLFLELMEQRMASQIGTFARIVDAVEGDALEGVQRWFDEGPASDPTWSMLAAEFSLHALRHPDVLEKLVRQRRQARDELAGVIAGAFAAAGSVPPRAPHELAELALAIGNGLAQAVHLDNDVPTSLFGYGVARVMAPPGGVVGS